MKKTALIFAVILFVASAAYSAGIDESPLYGTYMRATEYSDNEYSLTLFHLFPDHTGYYMSEWITNGKMEGAHEEMIVWMFTKEAKVQIALENGTMELSMGNYGQLKEDDGFIFTKVYPRRDWN